MTQNYFGKNYEEKDDLTLSCTPQEAVNYWGRLHTSQQSISDHFVLNIQLPNVFTTRETWPNMKDLANYKIGDIHGLKLEY